jgi:hypothetical protein
VRQRKRGRRGKKVKPVMVSRDFDSVTEETGGTSDDSGLSEVSESKSIKLNTFCESFFDICFRKRFSDVLLTKRES